MVVCGLFYATTASAAEPVERPLKMWCDLGTMTYGPGPVAVLEATGRGTHLGVSTSSGELVGITPENWLILEVTHTSANGDQLFEEALIKPGFEWISTFTGGTGRFEGATGGYKAVYTWREVDDSRIGEGIRVVTFGAEGSGTITY